MKKSILKKISERSRRLFCKKLEKDLPKMAALIERKNFSEIAEQLNQFDAPPPTKKMFIEVGLEYPVCDIYPARDTIDFLKDSIQDFLNQNLSDGDDRLKLVEISVMSERIIITIK